MYQSLQGCRAIAAALVVLFHLGGTFAQDRYFGWKAIDGPFAWGDAGVDFFFVLSGFLITIAHRRDFGRPQAFGAYLRKRTLRIYPTYWLICLAVAAAALVAPSLRQALPDDAATFIAALTLAPLDPAVVGGTGSPILFVAWSLQYEMLFYAIVAVAILNRGAGVAVAAALLAVSLAASLGCGDARCGFPATFVATNLVFLFAMGVATAYAVAWRARPRIAAPYALMLAAGAALAFIAFGFFDVARAHDVGPIDRRLVYGALSCLIVFGLVEAEDGGALAGRHPWMKRSGDASYALYLIHIPVISLLAKGALVLHPQSRTLQLAAFVAIFVACAAAALVFHRVVERPLLAWLKDRLDRPMQVRSVSRGADRSTADRADRADRADALGDGLKESLR